MATASSTEPLVSDLGDDGMPKGENEGASAFGSVGFIAVALALPRIIGGTIAWAIWHFGSTATYDAKISVLSTQGVSYIYLSAVAFSVLVSWLNFFPMFYKRKIMKASSGNLRANMLVYKVNVQDPGQKMPYVVLAEEGGIGEYNRANRSLHHFTEQSMGTVLNILLAGFVFQFPVFVLVIVFAVGRISHQIGYAHGGYGFHIPGFQLIIYSTATLEMLVFLSAYKSM
eukprot:TRINITY_DN75886_c0_g1_i1.p1 TRINITY_DN75886_c0_g1~~TRINITY_DN75886_c0_g1_i1.p1  ORF type:complete len:260 (+),score=28.82 TRINITY_DN75886_c0_g1_i1:99-782(+)